MKSKYTSHRGAAKYVRNAALTAAACLEGRGRKRPESAGRAQKALAINLLAEAYREILSMPSKSLGAMRLHTPDEQ